MGMRDRWPLRRRPTPPGFTPAPSTPDRDSIVAWQRHTPLEGWMTVPTDPRLPAPAVADTTEVPPMTEPDTDRPEPSGPPPLRKPACEACGRPFPTVADHLRASIDFVDNAGPTVGDDVVIQFYGRLFSIAPELRGIFPPDLLDAERGSDSRGFRQRDQLVSALRTVGRLYDPFNPKSMQALDSSLQLWGRRHAAFQMPDGSVLVPRRAHYDAVGSCLLDTLHDVAGHEWVAEWDDAWSEALEVAGDSMRHYARQWQVGMARLPRRSADPMTVRRRDDG